MLRRKKEARWIFIIHEINFFSVCAKKIPRVLTTKHECERSFCLTCFGGKQIFILLNECFFVLGVGGFEIVLLLKSVCLEFFNFFSLKFSKFHGRTSREGGLSGF